jgi:hypothetical protein
MRVNIYADGLDAGPWTILGAPLSVFEGGAFDFAFFTWGAHL